MLQNLQMKLTTVPYSRSKLELKSNFSKIC